MAEQGRKYRDFLEQLHKGETFTYEQAAFLLGTSKRTIERYIKRAKKEGEQIAESDKRHPITFSILEEHRQVGVEINLSEEEILALTVAADASHSTLARTPLGPALKRAIRKLIEQMPEEVVPIEAEESDLYWHFSSNPASEISPETFRELVAAIRDCAGIVVDYSSASGKRPGTGRPLDPYALAVQGGSWMLVAWCHWNKAFRDFSISAISNLRRTGRIFLRQEDFDLDKHFQGRFRAVGGTNVYKVRLLIQPDRVIYFKRKCYHPSQVLNEMQDGSAIVEYTVSGLQDIRSFAQSWGNGITVLAPPELVSVMREQANELAARYNGSASPQ